MKMVEDEKQEGITITYRHLLQTTFIPTLRKLYSMSVFDAKTAYRIHKIFDQIGVPYRQCWGKFTEIGLKYALTDENGKHLTHPEGSPMAGQHQVDPAKAAEYEKAMLELLDTTFVIWQKKLDVEQLTSRFSGEEMAALQPIVEGLE